ncbi:MAG: bifunctional riboflavin kinase/FAD synthetase [Myxococcota bacterium]
MQIFGGSAGIAEPIGPYAVVIGNFDGFHLGHQMLIEEVKRRAHSDALPTLAYTFHPHPASVLAAEGGPPLIEPLELRVERLAHAGFDATLIEPFSTAFASLSPEEFLSGIMSRTLQARHIVVGENFRYGHKAAGDVKRMRERGPELGFDAVGLPMVAINGAPVSSTRIRRALRDGDVALATALLGRPFAVTGLVMRGDQRGTEIGFPTANVATYNELLPCEGVYAARIGAEFRGHPAVVNIGFAPTFSRSQLKIEAHLLDFEARPLYGKTMEVQFVERIRRERRFDSAESLVEQIAEDVERTRRVLHA